MIVFPPNASRYDATSEIAEAQRKDRELIARLEKRVAELELFKERLTSALRPPEEVKKDSPSPFVIKTHWSRESSPTRTRLRGARAWYRCLDCGTEWPTTTHVDEMCPVCKVYPLRNGKFLGMRDCEEWGDAPIYGPKEKKEEKDAD